MSNILNECPDCGSLDTNREMIDWHRDSVEIVYTCDNCKSQFVTKLANPIKEVMERP